MISVVFGPILPVMNSQGRLLPKGMSATCGLSSICEWRSGVFLAFAESEAVFS